MTTIKDLLQGRSAEHQYKIMMLADQIIVHGRFYGGPLTSDQIDVLVEVTKEHGREKDLQRRSPKSPKSVG